MTQDIIGELISCLTKLPGIGRKTAQRLSFFILNMPYEDVKKLSKAIIDLKERARFCSICFNITEKDPCNICSNPDRDDSIICVVEEPANIIAIERTKSFNGRYHVLLGALSPSDNITPDKLKIKELVERIEKGGVKEIILATNPNTRGEITARYIGDILKPYKIKITRIAYGLPMGSDIEFADEVTLTKALEGRRDM
ncbi:MAG: recombination mediator RecR [Thermodesulfovibrionales bacterium]|nr:recombination mediator RecR [Thermodesulfovibrionales bacterium]